MTYQTGVAYAKQVTLKQEVKFITFYKFYVTVACYDTTGKGFFGPTGVSESAKGKGVGKELLLKCMFAMREEGYGYAIIGGASDAMDFYKKVVGATVIENSYPGIYGRMIAGEFDRQE